MKLFNRLGTWMTPFRVASIALLAALLPWQTVTAKTLPIAPVAQSQIAWCWLASAEMVFRYYRVPPINRISYQCGLAAAAFANVSPICVVDCKQCNVGSGTVENIGTVIVQYPIVAGQVLGMPVAGLSADVSHDSLSSDDVVDEIDAGRPIIAGISPHSGLMPPGLSEHAVVIVGYQTRADTIDVIINDPFPYAQMNMQDPYTRHGGKALQPGRYQIPYERLVDDLAWGNSISGIERQ